MLNGYLFHDFFSEVLYRNIRMVLGGYYDRVYPHWDDSTPIQLVFHRDLYTRVFSRSLIQELALREL